MADWQIIESDDFPELPPEPLPRTGLSLSGKWFWLVIAACLVVLAVGYIAVRREQERRQNIIRAELTATIFEEEIQRFLGQSESIPIVADAPTAWQQAYIQSLEYSPFETPPNDVNIIYFYLDPEITCATLNLQLADLYQKRRYCQSQYGWVRVPMPQSAWGDDMLTIRPDSNIELKLPSGDESFGQTLGQDILTVKQALSQQGIWPADTGPLKIILMPQEFKGPLIDTQPQQIVLNSPWATPFQPDTGLGGQAAVRLALGEALLGQFAPTAHEPTTALPGANRFLKAIHTVVAMRLWLTTEQQSALVNHWRTRLDRTWSSPFFADFYPKTALPAQFAANFTANTLPTERLIAIMQEIPAASSWDDLFQTTINIPAAVLEANAAAAASRGQLDPRPPDRIPLEPFPLPLTASLLQLNSLSPQRTLAQVFIAGRSVFVEVLPQTAVITRDGTPLPLGCIAARPQLEIDGVWLEANRRLQASKITVTEIAPLLLEPALPDTHAYVFSGSPQAPQALLAVADTATQMITPLSDTLRIISLPVSGGQAPHFLLRIDFPSCDRAWFGHYLPEQGVSQWWLSPPGLTQWTWQADRQNLIYLDAAGDDGYYNIYQSNSDGIAPEVIGRSNLSQKLLGWNSKWRQLVSQVATPDEGYFLALIDPASGEMLPRYYYSPLRGRSLSPSGEWLVFMLSTISVTLPANHQEVINMFDGSFQAVGIIPTNEGFWPAVWSPIIEQPQLVMLAGPASGEDDIPTPIRVILASTLQDGDSITLARAASGERFASPIVCSNGDVMYLVERESGYRLVRQQPGARARTVLVMGQAMHPLACP